MISGLFAFTRRFKLPEVVERCVRSLLADWRAHPEKKPKRFKSGDSWKGIETEQDLRSAAWGICKASQKSEDRTYVVSLEVEEVPFENPVMTGLGATNRPHLMGLDEVSIVEQNGEQLLKIPILILGRWLHRSGILNFTQEFVDKLKSAFESGVAGHKIAWDLRHKPQDGAYAWVKSLMQEVRADGKTQVSALADPTDSGVEMVRKKLYRYASIEFQPNFQDRRVAALSFEGEDDALTQLEEGVELFCHIDPSVLSEYQKEGDMPEDQEITLEQIQQMQQRLTELEQAAGRVEQLEQQLEQANATIETEQARSARLETMALDQYVSAVIVRAEAYRDSEQRAHPKMFLEWLERVLKSQPVGEDDAIKLESQDTSAAHVYYRKAAAWLAENMPGQVPMAEPQTAPDTTRPIGAPEPTSLSQDEDEELEEILGIVSSGDTATVGGGE